MTQNILNNIATSTARRLRRARRVAALTIMALLCIATTHALPTDFFASESVLATGRWVKISIPESGMYAITPAMMRNWGFTDAKNVRVHGYGAERIPDALTAANTIDDLPLAPQEQLPDGTIVFYGRGPESWNLAVSGRYVGTFNIYTNRAYYFVSETGADVPVLAPTGEAGVDANTIVPDVFNDRVHHEQDIATVGEAGGFLVGEDFRLTPNRSYTFNMPGRVEGSDVWFECSFVARTLTATSRLSFTANGAAVEANSTDVVPICSSDEHYHGADGTARHTLSNISGNTLKLGVSYSSNATVYGAWLNYLTVNYSRALSMSGTDGVLLFGINSRPMALDGVSADTRIWDVTSHYNVMDVNAARNGSRAEWTAAFSGLRYYAAWNPGAKFAAPQFEGQVANQNLHGLAAANMVIVTPQLWRKEAERLATIHRNDGLSVHLVVDQDIYNEFGSGAADVSALRRFFKMLYDRGAEQGTPLQYVTLLGRATYDNRHNTPGMAKAAPTLPSWYGGSLRQSLNDTDGFGTDDFLAMLKDGSGSNKGLDELSVAIGRIPVTSAKMLTEYLDKLQQYLDRPRMSGWKNQIMVLADDEDGGEHLRQAEFHTAAILATEGQQYMVNKVYMDAYTKSGGNYPLAREAMFRYLDEGTAWWTFIGHANNHSMTHDGQLTYNDINNMFLKHVPILYAATCDFLRWDSNTESGGEILMNTRYGGTIATISATRPVYIYENDLFSRSMGRQMVQRDDAGRYLRLGEIYRRAKNDIRDAKGNRVSSTNRLRYVLMGDPAMRLPAPSNVVRLDSIGNVAIDADVPPQVMALQSVNFSGRITDPDGQLLNGFNGYVTLTIYDAEESVVSNGNGDGTKEPFEQQGSKLFAGSAPVQNGIWKLRVNMPAEIADNYRPAAVNMYAVAENYTALPADSLDTPRTVRAEAIGVERRFYVAGFDDNAAPDSLAPVIEDFYLNHATFRDGDMVNPSPMAIATVSDNVGLNLSVSGVGHEMALLLDEGTRYTDVSQFYVPATDGSAGGTINYPLSDLNPGPHSLTLRVFDTSNNPVTRTIYFNVGNDVKPKIFDVYSDANPASTQANFYLSHNRPDQQATVTVTVYNLMGHPIWTNTVTGISDMFLSTPVTWDLTDSAGRRVPRGIYLYRATIKCDGESYDTQSRRLAVTN